MPEHRIHEFARLLSTGDNGMAVYGCTYRRSTFAGCAETETRRRDQPSPYAVQRAKRKAAPRNPRGGS